MEILSTTLLISTVYGVVITVLWARLYRSLERAKRVTRLATLQSSVIQKAIDSPEARVLKAVTAAQKNKSLNGEQKKGYVERQVRRQFPDVGEKEMVELIERSLRMVKAYGD